MKEACGIQNARIGLLSNGAEESKGNKLVKETFPLLREDESLNFIGNVEGTNALSGICDVLVCDGFAGNQVLKVTEGAAKRVITDVVKFAKKTGSEDVMALVKQLLVTYDIESLGGANLLGVRKPIVKMHGSANEKTVVNSTEMLLNMAHNKAVFDLEMFEKKETENA
jgi:glycerol-3-phosphate acyltransferase PlsX